MAMTQQEHQSLLDELREAEPTRLTEIALQLAANYLDATQAIEAKDTSIADLYERLGKVQEQNNDLFLAATAFARGGERPAIPTPEELEAAEASFEEPDDFLADMFDARGNMILPED